MAVMTYREALNLALREEMARDDRVFVIGEEVGLYEGAYKVTQGLLKEFGDPRLAVAAYNAGATPVRQWWKARTTDDLEVFVELIPFTETRGFVRRVMLAWEEYRRLYGSAAGARP